MKRVLNCRLCASDKLSVVIRMNDFEIIECKTCNIAFTNPAPSIPDYENMDFHSKDDSTNLEKITKVEDLALDWQILIQEQVKMIKSNFSRNADVLEIGCGEGILLSELQNIKFRNLDGFEPSRTAAFRARKKGLNIYNEYFNHEKLSKKYDLIIMSHVFEHIELPKDFLKKIKNVLKPGGSILLTQTNYKGLIPKTQKGDWYAWVPEQHFWHFTPKGIKKLFLSMGFNFWKIRFSSLVHPHDKYYKIGKLFPTWQDQFIILLKLN